MRMLKVVMLKASLMTLEGVEPKKRLHVDVGDEVELPESQARRLVFEGYARPPHKVDPEWKPDDHGSPTAVRSDKSPKVRAV